MVKPIWRLTEDNRGNFVRHEKRPPRSIFNRTFTIHLCVHAHLLAGWWLPYNRSIRGRNCIADTPTSIRRVGQKLKVSWLCFRSRLWFGFFNFGQFLCSHYRWIWWRSNHRNSPNYSKITGQIEVRLYVDIEFNRSNHWILLDDIGILKWIKELILNIGIKSGM